MLTKENFTAEAKTKILLVDDQPAELMALEAVLRSPEYELVQAKSGEEALQRVLTDRFALILLDVRMPGMSGFETASALHNLELAKDIPIIFITGVEEDALGIVKGYEAGAVDYLLKPFDADILKSKVSAFIELFKRSAKTNHDTMMRYHILADAIPHMVWQGKKVARLDYLNKVWRDYTGLDIERSKGPGWQSMINPEDLPALIERWKIADRAADSFEAECRIKKAADGTWRWHLVSMVPEKTASGAVSGWLGTVADIHDRRRIEEEMRKASQAAHEASRLKSDFLATMSHEIRTPMNAVIGMTELLLETELSGTQREYAETIKGSGAVLLTLINDLLDFSKIESGKLELEIIEFSLGDLVRGCERKFSNAAQEKNLRLLIDLPRDVSLNFRGDSTRIQQILMNLVSNALKFTLKGEITVKVRVSKAEAGKIPIRLEVSDTGVGIAPAALGRLFSAFSQADSSTTRKFGGTGLGLSISKRLAELMGGEIGVTSLEGVGSTFWVTLALEPFIGRSVKVEAAAVSKLVRRGNGGRILIAEDNAANQTVALHAVRKMGYHAEAVTNGNEVIRALKRAPYDLILMDWQMPEMDGREATQLIRTDATLDCKDIRIIAMTANAMAEDRERCINAGMDDYVAKPLDFGILAEKLENWMPENPAKRRK
jgi:PAS domain S-box-containing protein